MGAKTKKGNTIWSDSYVRGIIKNEKYIDDILMGKTFCGDNITKRLHGGTDNKTVVKEFLESAEQGLQTKDKRKLLNTIYGEVKNIENKISKLLDLHLEDKIDKINYEEKL